MVTVMWGAEMKKPYVEDKDLSGFDGHFTGKYIWDMIYQYGQYAARRKVLQEAI